MMDPKRKAVFRVAGLALVGLLVVGLVGWGGFFGMGRLRGGHPAPSPTVKATEAPLTVVTPTPTVAAETPKPTPTKVVVAVASPTAVPTPTPSDLLPQSGQGMVSPILIGVGLVILMGAARLGRMSHSQGRPSE